MPHGSYTTMSDEQRTARARVAAYAKHAQHDPTPDARAGQAGLRAKIERDLEAAGHLPADLTSRERARRVEAGYRAHFARLSYLQAKARARKAESS